MTVSFNPGMNPDAYARVYAAENNMSFEEAKAALKAEHGDPQAPTGESIFQNLANGLSSISEDDFDLSAFNIDDDNKKHNPLADLIAFFTGKAKETSEQTDKDDSTSKTDSTSKSSSSKKSSSKKDKVNDRQTEIDDTILEYMQHHNCTAEEAKEALYGKFGNPTSPSSSSSSSGSSNGPSAKRRAADDTVQEYMSYHNCSQEEAMKALQEMWGNPPER